MPRTKHSRSALTLLDICSFLIVAFKHPNHQDSVQNRQIAFSVCRCWLCSWMRCISLTQASKSFYTNNFKVIIMLSKLNIMSKNPNWQKQPSNQGSCTDEFVIYKSSPVYCVTWIMRIPNLESKGDVKFPLAFRRIH